METVEINDTTVMDLGVLLDAGKGAVVTLVAGDTHLAAHKAVLTARSPVFAAMFLHDTLESSSGQVTITDMEGPVLRELLVYFYTLKAPQLSSMAPQLLAAADKYGVLALKVQCEQQVAAQLSVETAATAAVLAVRHSCDSLRKAAMEIVKANLVKVMTTPTWADAVRTQPDDVVEVSQLLADAPTETSIPVMTDSKLTPGNDCRTPRSKGQTRTSAGSPAAASSISLLNGIVASFLQNLSGQEKDRRLIQAAKEGDVMDLLEFLAAGADLGARDRSGYTALHWAAFRGHQEAVRCLLGNRAEVNARSNTEDTPLHSAAANGHVAVVQLLVDYSGNPSARSYDGWTPLHLAAYNGHADVAATLLEAGADRRARDDRGRTPLILARNKNYWELVNMLRWR